jgi:hypothetical protein
MGMDDPIQILHCLGVFGFGWVVGKAKARFSIVDCCSSMLHETIALLRGLGCGSRISNIESETRMHRNGKYAFGARTYEFLIGDWYWYVYTYHTRTRDTRANFLVGVRY